VSEFAFPMRAHRRGHPLVLYADRRRTESGSSSRTDSMMPILRGVESTVALLARTGDTVRCSSAC
jgi:hypothetical protein